MLTILVLVGGGLALFASGHYSGSVLTAVRTKGASWGTTVMKDVQAVEAKVVPAVEQFVQHPLQTIEHTLAEHHATAVVTALDNLLKSAAAKAKDLEAHQTVIRDVAAKVETMLNPPKA